MTLSIKEALVMYGPVASLNTAWFALIGVLWTGYFVLEGFDFGVGMLSLVLGRDDIDRRMARSAIGPWWDGKEVALIGRGVAFEFRGKRDSARWRNRWDVVLAAGSLIPAFAWGLAFTDLLHGLPLSGSGTYLGSFSDLLVPVAVVGGLASLGLFVAHGATFLSVKTSGPLADRARATAFWVSPLAGALTIGTAAWLAAAGLRGVPGLPGAVPLALTAGCALAFVVSGLLVRSGRAVLAFGLSALGITAASAAIFAALFPRVLVSSGPGPSLTIWSAASANLSLVVMTVVAAISLPLVLLYQGWSYWVFRQRLTRPPGQAGATAPQRAPGPAAAAQQRRRGA